MTLSHETSSLIRAVLKAPYYFVAKNLPQNSLVPCFSRAEIALLEYWATEHQIEFTSSKVKNFHLPRGKCVLNAGLIKTAAEYAVLTKKKRTYACSLKNQASYLSATCRKILKPLREMNSRDRLNEQIRRGEIV